ncbi:MAG: DUF3025 domain-containing protein [Thiothrix sp.]|nr:DUF3025 domain-containing protein [Thiothrix sp.]HPQ96117.1 DUF3025 domain-containing protein [Thiolinea sp.]
MEVINANRHQRPATVSAGDWNPAFADRHPAFAQLGAVRFWEHCSTWPDCTLLGGRLPPGLQVCSGALVRFVPQDGTLPYPALYYEERIARHGLVATRANWHDFFNALVWGLYPAAKVRINTLHGRDIETAGMARTARRDALTLFDENGVVLVGSDRALLQAVLDFRWVEVFDPGAGWGTSLVCQVFGHALFEKLMTPYVGLTAHAILLQADAAFFELSLPRQQEWISHGLATVLEHIDAPDRLSPVPVLGIPGWWPVQNDDFFSNRAYFRSKQRTRRAKAYPLPPKGER